MADNEGPKFEILKPRQAFEILFPNYPLKRLPAIDPRSASQIPIELVAQTFFDGGYLLKAKEAGQGYARRVDLPHLDQITARALLSPAFLPFATLPKQYELRDFISADEQIGGGISHYFPAPNLNALDLNIDFDKPVAPGTRGMHANVIGIERKTDHKPVGILIYLPGPRAPAPKRVLVGVGRPEVIPVLS